MELISKLHEVLNLIKDFTVGYSTKNASDGYMLIEYKGKRYAVKIEEIKHPNQDVIKDIESLQYFI